MNWREFEDQVRKVCEENEFEVKFHFNFKDELGRGEIDVLAVRFDLVLGIDAKFYSSHRYRVSQLKREAEKHAERCKRLSKILGKRCIPVVVSFIDDLIYHHSECIIVPFHSFNEFLNNIYCYLADFGYI